MNTKFGEPRRTNFASKLYLLLYDTDVDLMVLTGSSRTTRYGFDFSKNLTTNLEIHGEFAVVNNLDKMAINSRGQVRKTQTEALSHLIGLRYLSEQETTYFLEYYRNGGGFSRAEIKDFVSFVNESYETFVNTGNGNGLVSAAKLLDGPYGMPNPGRHYLYFRASQKEPFDILYFTPAITSIMNLTDASLTVIPELAYSPMTNLELRFRTAFLFGKKGTEYGEKQNDYRIDNERPPGPHVAKSFPQQVGVFGQQTRVSVGQIDREEETPAGNKITPIAGHSHPVELAIARWVLISRELVGWVERSDTHHPAAAPRP